MCCACAPLLYYFVLSVPLHDVSPPLASDMFSALAISITIPTQHRCLLSLSDMCYASCDYLVLAFALH